MLAETHSPQASAQPAFPGTNGLLDSSEGGELDSIFALAAERFRVPHVLITLAGDDTRAITARTALDQHSAGEVRVLRDRALQTGEVLIVLDSHSDEALVKAVADDAAPAIRFFAAAPLELTSGECVGTLNIVDHAPRAAFSGDDANMLAMMAKLAVRDMEMRMLNEKVRIATALPIPQAMRS